MKFFATMPVSVFLTLLTVSTVNGGGVPTSVIAAVEADRSIWVFLHTEGRPGGQPKADPSNWLSARAIDRLQRTGVAMDPYRDAPIDERRRQTLYEHGFVQRTESRWFKAVAGWAPTDRLNEIAALPFVDSLKSVIVYRHTIPKPASVEDWQGVRCPDPDENDVYDYGDSAYCQIDALGVDSLHRAGLDGRGVRIGFLDTGFSLCIPVFDSLRLVAARDFIDNDNDVEDSDFTQMRHGTQTLSVCAGFAPGHLIGVAPRAEYAVAKTEIVGMEIEIEESNWVAGLEWLDSLGCDLVSSSLGYTAWIEDDEFDGNTAMATIAADLAAARGMLVVNAMGNAGCASAINIIVPADGDSVLAVGASTFDGDLVGFSSCGPTSDGRTKPDVIAPGSGVYVAFPRQGYGLASGTSFSAPLVTGVCALLLQNDPDLTPKDLIDRLRSTADQNRKPDNARGWGMVRAPLAAGVIDPPPYTVSDTLIRQRDLLCTITDFRAWPNPASDNVTIAIPIEDFQAGNGVSRFQVFTFTGKLAYDIEFTGRTVEWAGLTNSGDRVASGIYLCRLITPLHEHVIKLAWKRGR